MNKNARADKKSANKTTEEKSRSSSDNLCKMLAEKYPEQFIEWLFGLKPVGKVKILKTEFSREPIRLDTLILVRSSQFIFHIEFQTTIKSKPPMALRMLDYHVALKRKYPEANIKQVLIVLKETGEKIPDRYEGEGWHFPFNVVKMWEEEAEELMKHEGLTRMSPLCGTREKAEKHLKKVAAKISKIKDKAE